MDRKQHLHITSKRCEHCYTERAIHNFWPDRRTRDGFSNICDPCKREAPIGYSFVFRRMHQKPFRPGDKRQCSKCERVKEYSEFQFCKYRQRSSKQCKECESKRGKEYRKNLSPKQKRRNREYQKNYRQTEKGRESVRKGRQKYYQNNKEKFRARAAVTYAVLSKKLPHISTQTCQCGKKAENYHHHKGYKEEFRINVISVCRKCHYVLREEKAVYKT